MTQVLFNQFAYTDRLTRGGFTPEQARASAEALETAFAETVATKTDLDRVETALKADLTALKTDLDRVETALKTDLDRVETALKTDLDRVETGLKADIAQSETRLELKIAQAKHDTLKWIFTFNLALVGAIFAIVKFVH